MGLFDNIGQDRKTAQLQFIQEAQEFGKLDLNKIFAQGSVAAVQWFTSAIQFFKSLFGEGSTCTTDDGAMVERMIDQIPGMVLIGVKLGWLDKSFLDEFNSNPGRVDWIGNPRKQGWCSQAENVARALLTTLFGVRIGNITYLDNLDHGVDAYYASGGGYGTQDIPREAVVRAVYLKQTFFPVSTYNVRHWDMNQFQIHPLVKPIPDPFTPGKLYTGTILGVDVKNGLVQGNYLPNLPTSTSQQFTLTDPWHDIVYTHSITTGTGTQTTVTDTGGSILDKLRAYIKSNPRNAAILAAVAGIAIYELNED